MRKLFTLALALLGFAETKAQVCEDFAVELSARVQVSPPRITLEWKKRPDTTTFFLYKKPKNQLYWTSGSLAVLHASDSTYIDNAVIADSAYEYRIVSQYQNGASRWVGHGYIYAGIKCPATFTKGAIVLMVDSMIADSCSAALHTYMKDLSADGWQVLRHDISPSMKDTGVRGLVIRDYNRYPNLKAVQIVGHVAVPYSGDLNPDGHPDHLGAWPADVYYAQITATFTDVTINDTVASSDLNKNRIGDGKWDQKVITSFAPLQISRIDLSNMPAFSTSEATRMINYFDRAHQFKMDSLNIRRRAIINDNFGVLSQTSGTATYYEAFASCGWRNFPPLLSRDSFAVAPYFRSLYTGSYLWSYGCGGGWYQGAGGVGTTDSFAAAGVDGIFTMLFGSYFGDWNVTNSFLRAPLCSPTPILTNCWAGRPYWFFHHMALGENIGYGAWLSQNNDGNLYGPPNIYGMQQWVHQALMGDLSLRQDYIKRASNLVITPTSRHGATISWTASPDAGVIGYYVYRSDTGEYGEYKILNRTYVTGTTYQDTTGADGLKFYMVRPVKLQSTPSGAYYNQGLGISDSATVTYSHLDVPQVVLVKALNVFPNPVQTDLNINLTTIADGQITLSIVGVDGKVFAESVKDVHQGENSFHVNMANYAPGIYILKAQNGQNITSIRFEKI